MLEGAYSIDSYFFFNKLYRKNIHVMIESHLKSTPPCSAGKLLTC